MQIQAENRLFPVVVIYDIGSEVSLCNYETGPIVTDAKEGNNKVTISTINSIQAKLRQIYKLKLKDGWSMEAIMIPNMKLQLQPQFIPNRWYDLEGGWTDQDTHGVTAQILLGADQATLFPHSGLTSQKTSTN